MGGPAHTMAELDSMEEKLRRLGLGTDATVDPLKGKGKEHSEAYMDKIRTEQRDRRRLRREKEYRRYMASDPHAQDGDAGAEVKLVQATVENARDMLEEENADANEIVHGRDRKEVEKLDRAAHLENIQAAQRRMYEESPDIVTMPLRPDLDSAFPRIIGEGNESVEPSPNAQAKRADAVVLAQQIVSGLVELSFLVSDKRFLLEEELTGQPVRCVEQDLKVTEWREWVQLCLHPAQSPGDAESPHTSDRLGPDHSSVSEVATEDPEKRMALEQFRMAARQEEKTGLKNEQEAVNQVVKMVHAESRRLRKVALDDIRRTYEKSIDFNLPTSTAFGDSEGTPNVFSASEPIRMEGRTEVLPHWTHRLPPACSFVHGDELSGVRLLTEAIERQVRCALGPKELAADDSPAPTTGKSHERNAAAGGSQEKSIGVIRVEEGVRKHYITPRTLLGRTQPVANAATSGARAAVRHGGGGKGAPHHRPAEEDERKDFEVMADLLAREIVSAHFHNISQLTAGRVPLVSTANPPVDHTPRRAKAANKKEERVPSAVTEKDDTLHCIYLVGFPENESFYQLLETRLQPTVEAAEAEIAVEQHRLDEIAAAQAVSTPTPGSRGRTHSLSNSPPAKPKAPAPSGSGGRGKGSRNQGGEEAASLVAQQAARKALPPLCIMGLFIEYSIPARQQRLRDAYLLCSSPSPAAPPPTNKSSSPLPPPASVPTAPLTCSSGPLHHPVLNPEAPPPPPVMVKENTSRAPGEKSAPVNSSAAKADAAVNNSGGAASKKKLPAIDWDIRSLRTELVQRHNRMKRWQSQWKSAFGTSALAVFRRTVGSVTAPTPREKAKKRPSKSPPSNKEMLEPQAEKTVSTKEAFTFPKVLYFSRCEMMDDFSDDYCTPAEGEEDGSVLFPTGSGSQWDRERSEVVKSLLNRIGSSTRVSLQPLTNAQLIPNMLPEPLKLTDYRLPNEVCNDLLKVHEHYDAILIAGDKLSAPPPFDGTTDSAAPLSFNLSDNSAFGVTQLSSDDERTKCDTLKAEMRVYRAFSLQLKGLLTILSHEAFPDTIWLSSNNDFSTTVHYVSIDSNFSQLQQRMRQLNGDRREELEYWCAVLFRYMVDDALAGVASATENMLRWIRKRYFSVPSVASGNGVNTSSSSPPTTGGSQSTLASKASPPALHSVVGDAPSGMEDTASETCVSSHATPLPFPASHRVCGPEFHLSQDRTLQLLSKLFTPSESGLPKFWEAFEEFILKVKATLEEEVAEHIRYFAQQYHQECHRQRQALAVSTASASGAIKEITPSPRKEKGKADRSSKENVDAVAAVKVAPPVEPYSTSVSTNGHKTFDPFAELNWDAYVPQMVNVVLGRLFAAVESTSVNEAQSSISHIKNSISASMESTNHYISDSPNRKDADPARAGNVLVSPSLARRVLMIKEIVRCVESASERAQKWLEVMYRTALETPTNSCYPKDVRPRSLAELFAVPSIPTKNGTVVQDVGLEDASSPPPPSPCVEYDWPRLNLELSLSILSIYGKQELNMDEFLHCTSLAQLSKLWLYLSDEDRASDSLHLPIGFIPPMELDGSDDVEDTSLDNVDSTQLPDLLFTASFLSSECREESKKKLLFLHTSEMRTMFTRLSQEESRGVRRLELRRWMFKMVMRRCCFCGKASCPHYTTSCPLPSCRELRHAVAQLPNSVFNSHAAPLLRPYITRRTADGLQVRDQGISLEWWQYESSQHPPITPAMRRTFTRISTATFFLTKNGVLRQEYPSLPLLLNLIAHHPLSCESTLSRTFQCLAAVIMQSPEPQRFFEVGGASSDAAKDVNLSVEEFLRFFGSSGETPFSRMSTDDLSLEVDAQVMLQVEESTHINLTMLLSSHWGRALVDAHFKERHYDK